MGVYNPFRDIEPQPKPRRTALLLFIPSEGIEEQGEEGRVDGLAVVVYNQARRARYRGGDDLGYDWYLQGKAEQRWNTFHDFTDAAKGLIAANFARAGASTLCRSAGR